jgi:hypothetical protein
MILVFVFHSRYLISMSLHTSLYIYMMNTSFFLFQVQLSHSVSHWIVTPVGHKILSSTTGEHLGHHCPRMKYSIVLPLVLRFAFIPLIILCVNPLVIVNDPLRIIITILFALSSGWVYSACFMVASDMCCQLKHKEAASLLMVVSTLVALGIGSSAGLAIAGALI